jgi:hypothetical protein
MNRIYESIKIKNNQLYWSLAVIGMDILMVMSKGWPVDVKTRRRPAYLRITESCKVQWNFKNWNKTVQRMIYDREMTISEYTWLTVSPWIQLLHIVIHMTAWWADDNFFCLCWVRICDIFESLNGHQLQDHEKKMTSYLNRDSKKDRWLTVWNWS